MREKKDIPEQDVLSEPPSYKDDEFLRFPTYKNPVEDLGISLLFSNWQVKVEHILI